MQALSDSMFKHNGRTWCDCLALERHTWPMDQCLYWTGEAKLLTTCKLNGGRFILFTQVSQCQQATPKWINLRKHPSKNCFCSMASQSWLVWLSKMGTALVCGLPQLKVWVQGGTSIIPLRTRCHRLISCRTLASDTSKCLITTTELKPHQRLSSVESLSVNYTANCSIAPLMTQSKQNKG